MHNKEIVNNIIGNVDYKELDEKHFLELLNVLKDIMNKEERKMIMEELKREQDEIKKIELSKRLTELVKGCVKDGRN